MFLVISLSCPPSKKWGYIALQMSVGRSVRRSVRPSTNLVISITRELIAQGFSMVVGHD